MKRLLILVVFLLSLSFGYDIYLRAGVSAEPVKKTIASGSQAASVPTATNTPPSPTSTPPPTDTPFPLVLPPSVPSSSGQYKDGTYTGSTADAYYGYIQVQAVIRGGRLTDVKFLQYPSDHSTSVFINTQAMPMLRSEALQAQSANVDIVSGASDSSVAFQKSLSSALAKAQNS